MALIGGGGAVKEVFDRQRVTSAQVAELELAAALAPGSEVTVVIKDMGMGRQISHARGESA